MSKQQSKAAGIGQAFGVFLTAVASSLMFITLLVNSAQQGMDIVDNVLETGVNITATLKESSEDFRSTAKLKANAKYQARLKEINKEREAQGLAPIDIQPNP